MTNFLPEEFRAELEGLQDQVPPRPYADVEQRFREEFGKAPARAVRRVRRAADRLGVDRPGAPRARCTTGEKVAVKVQYPDIEEIVAHRSARAAPHLRRHLLVRPVPGPRAALSRDPRHGAAGARLPRRGRQRRAHRGDVHRSHRRRLSQGAARAVDGAHPDDRVDRRRQGLRSRAAQRARRRSQHSSRARSCRPTASRSSPTASITPIRTPGTCSCASAPSGRAVDRVHRLRRGRRGLAEDASRHRRADPGRHRARHAARRAGDEGDGLHRARRRPGDLRQGHRLLAPEVPGGDPARVVLA